MSCGIVARCDGGGLAALTREVHRHLEPARTLLLDLEEQGRGACIPDEYRHGTVYRSTFKGALTVDAIEWAVAEGIDTLWSAETFYDDRLLRNAHQQGIRTIVYAMPELAPWNYDEQAVRPRTFTAPTLWRFDTLPANTQLLPLPVARDRLPFRERKTVAHLFHTVGKAMLDRNGTELLLAALPFLAAELRVTIRSESPLRVPACRSHVEVEQSAVVDYWDCYPGDIDLLVQPRRYGGLSLPIIECASLGVPAVTLQTDPYAQMDGADFVTAIPSTGASEARMKGGRIPVQAADPRTLAAAIDFLVEHPEQHAAASQAADRWAAAHAWDGPLGDRWRTPLGA